MHHWYLFSIEPYGLNTPELLEANYEDCWKVLAESKKSK